MNIYEWRNKQFFIGLFFAVIIASLYTYAVIEMTEARRSDYWAHARFARELLSGERLLPHFLFQVIVVFIHKVTGISFIASSYVAVFFSVFSAFIIAYKYIKADVSISIYLLSLGTVFLFLSQPIAILAPLDQHLYLGYITANVYHNPTLILLVPIALLHFILTCEFLGEEISSDKILKKSSLLALLTVLSIVAKPNYIIVFLPAIFGYLMINHFFFSNNKIRKQEIVLILAVSVPTLLLLAWQYLFFYGGESKNQIGIDLFAFFKVYSELWTLVPKLLLSIAFPISVAVLLGHRLFRQKDFQFSFLMFCLSLVYAYGFVDRVAGGGISNGNFYWSAQIAHFILFYVCIKNYLVFLSDKSRSQGRIVLLPMVVGACHLFFWLPWYYSSLNPDFWLHF